ncbi:hypothetical protein [Luteimicrobium subarcticum]|uniref:Surface-anchored protein n=1 Tax=Luteimicrobium subarcticum TaxID=620910 RepID=A0A2M8WW55_9MICO|nr:hypothetical protein [Luteimicrobium subarcticum]PJI95148.1 hypothetical protein CLV34_1002 [Luteimicrobium subarcticum]
MVRTSLTVTALTGALVLAGAAAPALAAGTTDPSGPSTARIAALAATAGDASTTASTVKATVTALPDVTVVRDGSVRVNVTITLSRALQTGEVAALAYGPASAEEPNILAVSGTGTTLKAAFLVRDTAASGTWVVDAMGVGGAPNYPTLFESYRTFHVKRPTVISLHSNHGTAHVGGSVAFTGQLNRLLPTGSSTAYSGFAGQIVRIYADPVGSAPKKVVATARTTSTGAFSRTLTLDATATYTATYGGVVGPAAAYAPKTSSSLVVHVVR